MFLLFFNWWVKRRYRYAPNGTWAQLLISCLILAVCSFCLSGREVIFQPENRRGLILSPVIIQNNLEHALTLHCLLCSYRWVNIMEYVFIYVLKSWMLSYDNIQVCISLSDFWHVLKLQTGFPLFSCNDEANWKFKTHGNCFWLACKTGQASRDKVLQNEIRNILSLSIMSSQEFWKIKVLDREGRQQTSFD